MYFSLFLHVNDGCGIISIRWSSDLMTDELQKHNSGKNGGYWQKKQKNHSRIGASRFASLTGRGGAPVLLDVIQFSLSLSICFLFVFSCYYQVKSRKPSKNNLWDSNLSLQDRISCKCVVVTVSPLLRMDMESLDCCLDTFFFPPLTLKFRGVSIL